ncbi:type II toxin-antitoxin system HicA family toxin [Methylobacterium sp. J-030]|uniref:type II toxin-antitoxin system HicA family toxin n=1 Tax=Methylobacterium sp. J-030 TaxID=2836627 RepID=UPI001FB95D5A|nr:type II toxin-antitoxin system HicA family toxin [Methylobacterium sp. J-030]MCJ2071368.1 type II toxin-antitoxin system HicA family toxin [Methylobacterium sp. J-030]
MSRTAHGRKIREVIAALYNDGWYLARKGPGDHVEFKRRDKPGKVTIDTGASEIPTGTLRSIYRQAGWTWG